MADKTVTLSLSGIDMPFKGLAIRVGTLGEIAAAVKSSLEFSGLTIKENT